MHNISSLEGFPEVDHDCMLIEHWRPVTTIHLYVYIYSSLPRFFDEAWSTTSVDHSLVQ